MASEKLLKELNDQFNFELYSGYYYMEMAAYFSDKNLNGFAHFFIEQAKEEYFHAMRFYDFIFDMDGRVKTQKMDEPKSDYKSNLEVFEVALAHEKEVTRRIFDLLNTAKEEDSYYTIQFLQWFVEEQREEENTMKDIVHKLESMKDDFKGIYMLDKELGARPAVTAAEELAE